MASTTFVDSQTPVVSSWLNDVNDAVYLGTFPNGISSQTISYTPSGTGAVTTTVQNKLSEFVSVKDFGATGNGVSDDTLAFINAVATGKSIYIPSGNYLITSTITLSEGQILQGEGRNLTTITSPDAFNSVVFVIKQGCGVNDMNFTKPTTGSVGYGVAIQIDNSVSNSWNTSIKNINIQSYRVGINVTNYRHYIENVQFYYCSWGAVVGYDTTAPAGTTQFVNCAFLHAGTAGLWVRSTATHTQVKASTFELSNKHIVCDGLLYVDSCYIADQGAYLVTGAGRIFIENGMVAPFLAGAVNSGADYGYNFVTTDDEYAVSIDNAIIKNVTMGTEWQYISGNARRGAVMGPGKYVLENCYFKNNVADSGSPSPYYALWPLEYNASINQQIMENSTKIPNYVTNGVFRNRSAVISNYTSSGLFNPWGGDIKVVPAGQTCTIPFTLSDEYELDSPLLLMVYVGTVSGGYLKVNFNSSTDITADDATDQQLIQYDNKISSGLYQLNAANTYGSKHNFALNSFVVSASSTTGTIDIESSGTGTGQIAAVILTTIGNDPDLGRPIGWFYNP